MRQNYFGSLLVELLLPGAMPPLLGLFGVAAGALEVEPEVEPLVLEPAPVLPLVQAGRLRALAITSRNASPLVPGVPGMSEAGLPGYEISFWYGFFLPAGTPAAAMKRLYDETAKALKLPQVEQALAKEGTEVSGSASPADFTAFLAADAALWTRLVKDAGVKAD